MTYRITVERIDEKTFTDQGGTPRTLECKTTLYEQRLDEINLLAIIAAANLLALEVVEKAVVEKAVVENA